MTRKNLEHFLRQIEEKYAMSGWPSDNKLRKAKIRKITEEIKLFLTGLGKPVDQFSIAEIWSYFFMNTQNENWLQALAIFYFKNIAAKRNGEMSNYWSLLKNWVQRINHWGFSDMTSSVLSQIVEDKPEIIYPTLCEWAANDDPWYKRVAIVSLIYYYRCRKTFLPFSKVIDLLEPQIKIDHYYLQKGVGWVLKELSQAYPEKTFNFIMNNADKISVTAFSAAVEKIPKKQKEEIKTLRKELKSIGVSVNI